MDLSIPAKPPSPPRNHRGLEGLNDEARIFGDTAEGGLPNAIENAIEQTAPIPQSIESE
jgi:hypothetical protein